MKKKAKNSRNFLGPIFRAFFSYVIVYDHLFSN